MKWLSTFVIALALAVTGCTPVDNDEPDASADAGGTPDAGNQNAICTAPNAMDCEDQNILQLSLHDFVSSGSVSTTEADGVFTSVVDAVAGGMNEAPNNPYIYLKFNDSSLDKVEVDDETALGSMDWDLMARRFVVFANGGDIGPSCVGVAPVAGAFADVTAPPAESDFFVEDTFGDPTACTLRTDSRYTLGDPLALMMSWWTYANCVKTSGKVFVLRLASGRHVKLVIDAFYASGQAACNASGTAGSGGGMLTLRWAWL